MSGADLLALLRLDPAAALEHLYLAPAQEIAERVQELHPSLRNELLCLLERPEEVVPLVADAELASTIRASGLAEGGWLLEFASPDQRVACVDLDCWQDFRFSHWRFSEWVDALLDTGTLVQALEEFDPELWVLALRRMADFKIMDGQREAPPAGLTEDGIVYYAPHSEADAHRLGEILRTALSEAPSRYWQLVYGAIYEDPAECEQYAYRWRSGRLNDLGFPDRSEALRLYRRLELHEAPVLEAGPAARRGDLVAAPQLPQRLAGTLVGRALAGLSADRATDVLGYVLAVGNAVAVADRLPLADAESIEEAVRKAARGIDRGLEALMRARGESASRVLDQTRPLDLFRIGASIDPSLRPKRSLGDLDLEEAAADWGVETEEVEPEIIEIRPPARSRPGARR